MGINNIELSVLASYDSGLGEGAAEIVAHDAASQRLFIINAEDKSVDIVDISDASNPSKIGSISLATVDGTATGGPNSVAVSNGLVAVAVEAETQTDEGLVAFFDIDGTFKGSVAVGILPDMLTFNETGTHIVVANEAQSAGDENEPDALPNPNGSVSVIEVNAANPSASSVTTLDFTDSSITFDALADKDVRINRNAPSAAADLEPEYVSIEGNKAYISLQENNAVAVIEDITNPTAFTIDSILGLGTKDHSVEGNGLDASNRDDAINIDTYNIRGLYQPDSIATYTVDGKQYFVTANEGDGRDVDESRGDDLLADFIDTDEVSAELQAQLADDAILGRLKFSNVDGDIDGDGKIEVPHAFGARSFSIFDEDGNLVFDSGDDFEQITAVDTPLLFNANDGDTEEFDNRSDDKGPEPEAVTIGQVGDKTFAFVGLERAGGGIMVYDITDPANSSFVQYIRNDGDIAPEGLAFIAAEDSPTGAPLLAVANEVSGTTTLFTITESIPTLELWIVNADTDEKIIQLSDGQTISSDLIPDANLSIAAFIVEGSELDGEVSSIKLDFNDGQATRTESVEPYALFGDRNGDFRGKSDFLKDGANNISIELFSGNGGKGDLVSELSVDFTIADEPTPTLTLTIDETSVSENGGTATATITRDGDTTNALTVTLGSDDTSEATVPATIEIAAGQTSATFEITAQDDADLDGTQTATISASADGFAGTSASLDVTDDEVPSNEDVEIFLINADTDEKILRIEDGINIDPATLPDAKLTFAAFVSETGELAGDVESIKLDLNDGQSTRTENVEPYALFGDRNGDFRGRDNLLADGDNKLNLELFSGNGGKGDLVKEVEINFTVGEPADSIFTLELLHFTDQEAAASAIQDAPNLSAVLNALRNQDVGNDGLADNTLTLSSGDAFIPGLFFDASNGAFGAPGIADILIQNELGVQAIALGNHEFDFGTEVLAGLIDGSAAEGFDGTDFPYLSTNLDFSTDANLAGLEIAGGQAPQGGVVTSSTVIAMPANGASMLTGENGFTAVPIFTVGETFSNTSGALNSSSAGDYTPPGILDGLGAYELNETTVRVFGNHELVDGDGYAYSLENGLSITGARISYFDIDKETKQIVDSGLAYDTMYDQGGNEITDVSQFVENRAGITRFCSSILLEAEQFGNGSGLADRIYFAGEETGGGFSNISGGEWALDVATGELWAIPAMGRGAWENVTEIDTGTSTHVAFILADDTSPFDADGDGENEAAPLFLYVGEKGLDADGNASTEFLARNGLEKGKLFVWVADGGALDPRDFNTSGTAGGTWVEVDNSQNLALADENGAQGYDEFGYPTQQNLWTQAEALGAFGFSRPEDVATNPADGTEIVLASTGRSSDFDGADQIGTLYTVKTDFTDINAPTSSATIIYDGDADASQALRSPDNLDWADDGFIYVQEDRAIGGIFGEGAANPNDASIVKVDPATGEVTRVAEINQDVTRGAIDENVASSGRQDVGDWESSGILDVSTLFGEAPGTLFIADVQAHALDDQDRFPESGQPRLTDDDLKEGGQLTLLAADGVNLGKSADKIGVVGATTPTLASISSPGEVGISPTWAAGTPTDAELDALAAEIQTEVDALLAANPDMNKVVLLAHMQQISIEQALAERLIDVDIIVAGGSNTRLFDDNDRIREGDSDQGQYPQFITNAGGTQTALVNTDGSYKYVGRLVVDFDEDGNIIPGSYNEDVSGAYATDDQGVADLNAEGLVDQEIQDIVDAIETQIIATESNVFGVSDVFLNGNRSGVEDDASDTDGVRTQETNLGNLTADANLAAAQEIDSSVLVSIKNGGGIRASIGQTVVPAGGSEAVRLANEEVVDGDGNIVKPEGGISQNDIQTTLAFNNGLTLLTLTKAELVAVLEHGVGAVPEVSGRFPQVSGLKFSYDPDQPEGDRLIEAGIFDEDDNLIMELVRDGELVGDASTEIRIVTLDFLAAPRFDADGNFIGGGDGYPWPNTNTDASVGEVGADAARINAVQLEQEGVQTGDATFADDGTEQDALAEYLNDNFNPANGGTAYSEADEGRDEDGRIQNANFQDATDVLPDVVEVAYNINEIHYDNEGGDTGEFIEIRTSVDADVSTLTVVLYNGTESQRSPYNTLNVADGVKTTDGDFDYYVIEVAGIQNGAPDGLALVNDGSVVEFLSYEGTFVAASGPAAGMTSTDIGVAESAGTAVGDSLQLAVDGSSWNEEAPETKGAANEGGNTGGPLNLAIFQIQGAQHVSPYNGQSVITSGIVTAVAFNGFYMQDAAGDNDTDTSDAIFVFTGSSPAVAAGDDVTVEGTVSEFIPGGASTGNLSTTQISSVSNITTNSNGNVIPTATKIGGDGVQLPTEIVISNDELPVNLQDDIANIFDPAEDALDLMESLEAMLVTIVDPLAVSPTRVFNAFSAEFFVVPDDGANVDEPGLNDRGGLTLASGIDNTGDQNPEKVQVQFDPTLFGGDPLPINVGDDLSDVTGVVNYSFGNFEIFATEAFTVETPSSLTQEVTALTDGDNQLTVATYNVLNLTSTENGDPDAAQRTKLADQIVNNLANPNIIALQEIQDNNGTTDDGTTSADQTLADLVTAISDAGGVTYTAADVAPVDGTQGGVPGGNIRNAFLYNENEVTLTDLKALDVTELTTAGVSNANAFDGTRIPLLGVFEDNDGNEVFVINVHFSSRFGSTPVNGAIQPFVQAGEEARELEASTVNEYVDYLLSLDTDANVMVMGDMNTFQFTDELTEDLPGTGADQVLTNLIDDAVLADDAYTFIFDGNSQALDHAFVTDGLLDIAELDIVHVNNDFARDDNAIDFTDTLPASDHEPILVRLDFGIDDVPA